MQRRRNACGSDRKRIWAELSQLICGCGLVQMWSNLSTTSAIWAHTQGRNHVFKVGGPFFWSRVLLHFYRKKDRSIQFGAVSYIITLYSSKSYVKVGVPSKLWGLNPQTPTVVAPMGILPLKSHDTVSHRSDHTCLFLPSSSSESRTLPFRARGHGSFGVGVCTKPVRLL